MEVNCVSDGNGSLLQGSNYKCTARPGLIQSCLQDNNVKVDRNWSGVLWPGYAKKIRLFTKTSLLVLF
jgi:hypothetical protein